ncbi:MAG: hypothetical protein ACRYGA_14460 [Janthinobacterium lividum]
MAGLLSRVTAGLGVLEAAFVALLASQMAQPALIAGVLLYRAFYCWTPLLEVSAKRLAAAGSEE